MQTCWKLKDIYQTNEAFNADLKEAEALLDELKSFKNKLKKNSKKILKKYFENDTKFSVILEKLAVYAHCKHDDNAKDKIADKNYNLLNDFFVSSNEALSFVRPELAMLDEKFLLKLKTDPEFEDYSRVIDSLIRNKKHTLSTEKEGILATVSGFSQTDDIYDLLSDIEMNHGTVVGEDGNEIKLSTGNYNLLLKSPSQEFRKKVMETYLAEYGRLNLTYSGLYLSHVKYVNFVAKLRGFSSALDMETYGEELTAEIMLKNIEFVSAKTPLLREFFKVKKSILGLDKFYSSDITANLPYSKPNEPFGSAVKDIRNCFEPLGEDYQKMFDEALKDGWIDALPRENKASGGYTISNYTCHPYILLNYDGTAYWKSAIAHEFGHAMHSYYCSHAQPYAKYDYTIFVAEVASLTNEILLTHYLLEHESRREVKMQILCDFLGTFYLNVFNSSMLAEFELFVHDGLWQGKTLTSADLNGKMTSLYEKYFGDSVKSVSGYEFDWERKSHIFRDYYLYKYSTGFVSACAVASKILSDKTQDYVKKYKNFLQIGGSMPPLDSLKAAEIDITKKETYDHAFSVFEEFLNELKKLSEEKV